MVLLALSSVAILLRRLLLLELVLHVLEQSLERGGLPQRAKSVRVIRNPRHRGYAFLGLEILVQIALLNRESSPLVFRDWVTLKTCRAYLLQHLSAAHSLSALPHLHLPKVHLLKHFSMMLILKVLVELPIER